MALQNAAVRQYGELFDENEDENVSKYVEPLCWADGLITSVAAGPQGVSVAELLVVLGSLMDFTPETEWTREPLEIVYTREYNRIVNILRRDPCAFVPSFEGLADEVSGAEAWADGFREGMALRPAAWRALAADRDARHWLAPIMILSLGESEVREILRPEVPRRAIDVADCRRECARAIADGVAGIYRYWHSRHSPRVQAPGRNALCPCGSGRKYKKCCLG